ncbi:MAG: universal stress protein [Segniliparus sp.]|uniref:universal stress protein n=1 Tax=Segniliparus sp. TaxID=2804064 RepID=UPI003F375EA9
MTNLPSAGAVVVGVNETPAAVRAAFWAADEASRLGAPLRLVHAYALPLGSYGLFSGTTGGLLASLEAEGNELLAGVAKQIRRHRPRLDVDLQLHCAPTVDVLVEEAKTAQMIVLGEGGLPALGRVAGGSAAADVLARGRCPVAVVRGHLAEEDDDDSSPVTVGVDSAATSEPAVRTAFAEADRRGVGLLAVHTWTEHHGWRSGSKAEAEDEGRRERDILSSSLAEGQRMHPRVRVKQVLAQGPAAELLMEEADKSQLLVLGSRNRNWLQRALRSSTSQDMLRRAPCPVLVVPAA